MHQRPLWGGVVACGFHSGPTYSFGSEAPIVRTVREDDADLPVIDLEFMD